MSIQTPRPPAGEPRKPPSEHAGWSPHPASIIRRICTGCLRGFVHERGLPVCAQCGCGIRLLAAELAAGEFAAMSDEQKLDLRTRKEAA